MKRNQIKKKNGLLMESEKYVNVLITFAIIFLLLFVKIRDFRRNENIWLKEDVLRVF